MEFLKVVKKCDPKAVEECAIKLMGVVVY